MWNQLKTRKPNKSNSLLLLFWLLGVVDVTAELVWSFPVHCTADQGHGMRLTQLSKVSEHTNPGQENLHKPRCDIEAEHNDDNDLFSHQGSPGQGPTICQNSPPGCLVDQTRGSTQPDCITPHAVGKFRNGKTTITIFPRVGLGGGPDRWCGVGTDSGYTSRGRTRPSGPPAGLLT